MYFPELEWFCVSSQELMSLHLQSKVGKTLFLLEASLASSFLFSNMMNLLPVVSEHLMTPFYRRTAEHLLWGGKGTEQHSHKLNLTSSLPALFYILSPAGKLRVPQIRVSKVLVSYLNPNICDFLSLYMLL